MGLPFVFYLYIKEKYYVKEKYYARKTKKYRRKV